MASIEVMRRKVKEAYPNTTWAFKVDRMPDNQVKAIYLKLKEKGSFDKGNKVSPIRGQMTLKQCFPDLMPEAEDKFFSDVRGKLTTICEMYDNQVTNYKINPAEYAFPGFCYVESLFKEADLC